jgi:hypothetical protein
METKTDDELELQYTQGKRAAGAER